MEAQMGKVIYEEHWHPNPTVLVVISLMMLGTPEG